MRVTFIKINNDETKYLSQKRHNFSLVVCYLLQFIRFSLLDSYPLQKLPVTRCKITPYTLLVSESLVSRCKSRSLLVAKHALYLLQIKSLLDPVKTTCNSLLITHYLLLVSETLFSRC